MEYIREIVCMVIFGLFCTTLYNAAPKPGQAPGTYQWMFPDNFDEIMDKMSTVTIENCRSKPRQELELPEETVSQVPVYNKLLTTVIYANRSMLLHLHNMALNRAFYYSFIYQRMNRTDDFPFQPGLMYLYMSAAADVSASPGWINGSSLLFDNNCTYPNWYTTVDFNTTLELFGPRAWRADDYNEPTNWLREPTNRTVDVHDYAAGRVTNYTNPNYKYCPYSLYEYDPKDLKQERPRFWWPDDSGYQDSLRKFTYNVGVKFSNETGKFIKDEFEGIPFFGPPQPGQRDEDITLPVMMTKPYFDCGRSNRWIVSMSSPVVDYMPRYSIFIHLRRPRFVAIAGMDAEFERIDINPCPTAEGNPEPNYFANTARCRPTTQCEPLHGWGFRRGGYQCACNAGYYYPWWHDGPFQGWEIEQATTDEYLNGAFDCLKVEEMQVIPNVIPQFVERRKRSTRLASIKDRFMFTVSEHSQVTPRVKLVAKRSIITADGKKRVRKITKRSTSASFGPQFQPLYEGETPRVRRKRDAFEHEKWTRAQSIINRRYDVTNATCKGQESWQLYLPGDAGYGAEKQFEAQGRAALRMAHFLSNFLQNVDEYEEFGNLKGDRRLNETHIFGEVIAAVMADFRMAGFGVFFDRYKFKMSTSSNTTDPRFDQGITREFFGPYAYEIPTKGDGLNEYKAVDFAGYSTHYVDEPWFRRLKSRWATNYDGLKKYIDKPMIRSGPNITSLIRFEHYPITYRGPKYEDGEWSRPTFKCDDKIMDWVITYTVPFFGLDSLKTRVEFKGVVMVDVKMSYLDINQCPGEFYVANAFKNTAKCDYQTQYCVPLPGKRFSRGAYKCECRHGYEYPFNDLAWFYDGQNLEKEYEKKMNGQENRYDTLKCRIAAASSVLASWSLVASAAFFLLYWNK